MGGGKQGGEGVRKDGGGEGLRRKSVHHQTHEHLHTCSHLFVFKHVPISILCSHPQVKAIVLQFSDQSIEKTYRFPYYNYYKAALEPLLEQVRCTYFNRRPGFS